METLLVIGFYIFVFIAVGSGIFKVKNDVKNYCEGNTLEEDLKGIDISNE